MKTMKFLTLSLLAIVTTASAKIHFSGGVMRNEVLYSGANLVLEVGQRELCYQDEVAYIEVELIEQGAQRIVLQFTVATKNESGAFMVRGLPKLSIETDQGTKVINSSLRCDGPNESFAIIATVEKIEEDSSVQIAK